VTTTAEKHAFQAETRQLLELMIHSLYKNEEIFLRELLSNASDALDKLRYEALKQPELWEGDERLHVRLEPDADARTLRVVDNGIGMTRDEVIDNVGTIARSGTRRFLEELRKAKEGADDAAELPELIGQFGVGFYSAFMVADEVVLETRKAGEARGVRWVSRADGEYTVEPIERAERGTSITLHLKGPRSKGGSGDGEVTDFTEEWVLRSVVKRYSDFVEYPIEMDVERQEVERDAEGKEVEGGETKRAVKTEVLNSRKPLWTRPASEVTPEEHAEFYKHVAHDWEPPLDVIHFKAEGTVEYTALLYLPKNRPFDLFEADAQKSRLSLYVKRVFVTADCEELLPPWLRFVRGIVDSADLPLNVSRETLQHARQMGPIKKRLTKKVLDALDHMLEEERAKYLEFWKSFGKVLKEGIYYDDEQRRYVAGLSLFQTSRGDELSTLDEYVERMPVSQPAIYTIAGPDRAALEKSPHLEALFAKGYEVVYLTDQVDEFALSRLSEFEGKPIRPVERGEIDLEDEAEKRAREEQEKEREPLLAAVREKLGERVSEVRFSGRLKDSPAVLVSGQHELSPNQARILRAANQEVSAAKRALELNPAHPLIERLEALRTEDDARFGDYCELVLGQALLAEGSPLPDPGRFTRLVSSLMVGE
jgi:molecular chaperone HtpG